MSNVKVSVIMSVYNSDPNQLKEAINSILNQTYENLELIIINDGSTTDVENIVNSFLDNRIKFINNPINLGLPASLNKGVSIALGKYIARMDSDDISLPNRIEAQVNFMESNSEIGVLGSNAQLFGTKKGIFKLPTSHLQIQSDLLINSAMVHPSVMVRKDLLIKNPYDENDRKAEDYKLWTKLIWKTKFANLNMILLKYRFHENQKSKEKSKEIDDHRNKIREYMLSKFDTKLTEDEKRIFFDSANLKLLSESEINKLVQLSNKLILNNTSYGYKQLIKTLSVNLDRSIYIFSKYNKKVLTKYTLSPKHPFNKFKLLKYLAFLRII